MNRSMIIKREIALQLAAMASDNEIAVSFWTNARETGLFDPVATDRLIETNYERQQEDQWYDVEDDIYDPYEFLFADDPDLSSYVPLPAGLANSLLDHEGRERKYLEADEQTFARYQFQNN